MGPTWDVEDANLVAQGPVVLLVDRGQLEGCGPVNLAAGTKEAANFGNTFSKPIPHFYSPLLTSKCSLGVRRWAALATGPVWATRRLKKDAKRRTTSRSTHQINCNCDVTQLTLL